MKRGLLILATGILIWILWLVLSKVGDSDREIAPSQNASSHFRPPSPRGPDATRTTHLSREVPEQAIEDACSALKQNPADADRILHELKSTLQQSSSESAANAVLAALRKNMDAATDQPFAVGAGGALEGIPSLRTALLNWLPTFDPEVALEASREILRTTESPDEYALALRNLAWNDLNGDLHPELSAAFHAMLDRREWRDHPSDGFLEAFDIAVKLNDTHTFLRLSELASMERDQPDLVQASCMSMDRMILRHPEHLSQAWQNEPEWMDQAPMQRASLMSRLDVTRDDHRAVWLDYLQSPRIRADELDYFSRLFPNGNHLYGHRLTTGDEKSPTIEERTAMDREMLRITEEAMASASPTARIHLETIRDRLSAWASPKEKPSPNQE